jgi:hypothetical protein
VPERGDCALRDVALGMEPASGAQLALPARLRHAVPASMQVRLRLWHRSRALRHPSSARSGLGSDLITAIGLQLTCVRSPTPPTDAVERSTLVNVNETPGAMALLLLTARSDTKCNIHTGQRTHTVARRGAIPPTPER